MDRYSIKLKVNLKIGSGDTLSRGHVFSGLLKDFPEEIQEMVKDDSRHLEIAKETPQPEVTEVETPEITAEAPKKKLAPRKVKKTSTKTKKE